MTALGADLRHAIGWCDLTLNPGIYGCQRISPACGTADNTSRCYAEVVAYKLAHMAEKQGKTSPYSGIVDADGWTNEVRLDFDRIAIVFATLPRKASARIRRVFVTSMSDLFHKAVTFAFLDAVFAEMEARPWIAFQVLTKRADRMAAYAADRRARGLSWPANVWAGVTVEDQRRADERIPHLLTVGAAVTFLSMEPLLGPVDLTGIRQYGGALQTNALTGYWRHADLEEGSDGSVNWVILGCESDGNRPGKRETDPAWVEDLVTQCDRAGVPVFLKQLAVDGHLVSRPEIHGRARLDFPVPA